MSDHATTPHPGHRPTERRWYSVSEVAAMLGVSPMTIYRAISLGQFPAVRIRNRLIVPAKALDAMEGAATATQTSIDAGEFASTRR